MLTMNASDVRKDWSKVLDSVIRRRPAFIKRTHDHMVLSSAELISNLVSDVKFNASRYDESDGSVTLSLEAMDIVSNGKDLEAAKKALVSDIVEYAEEYYNEFERYSHAPNRKSHLPYVMKALTAETPEELEDAVVCRDGEN